MSILFTTVSPFHLIGLFEFFCVHKNLISVLNENDILILLFIGIDKRSCL